MILNLHIFRNLFLAIFVTLIGFAIVDFILSVLNELNYELAGEYQSMEAFTFIALTAPARLYNYFPYICLIGVLFSFGQMADHRELVVVESMGITKGAIVQKALIAPLVWLILAFLLGESLVPKLDQHGFEQRNIKSAQGSTKHGVWHKDKNRFYFFKAVKKDGSIQGGYSVEYIKEANKFVYETFESLTTNSENEWLFTNKVRHELDTNSDRLKTFSAQTEKWETDLKPELLWLITTPNVQLSVFKLYEYSSYLADQRLDTTNFKLKFWQRLLQPILGISLIWLAVTFIFGPLRQSSTGGRIFAGLMVAVVFNLFQSLIVPLSSAFQMPPLLAASLPIIIICTSSLLLQYKKG